MTKVCKRSGMEVSKTNRCAGCKCRPTTEGPNQEPMPGGPLDVFDIVGLTLVVLVIILIVVGVTQGHI